MSLLRLDRPGRSRALLLRLSESHHSSAEVTDAELLADSPLPLAEFLLQDLQWAPAASRLQDVTGNGDSRSPG